MKRPNILLLFTDQQRHDTISALGNSIIRTPTLDRLVREGTSFNRCYTPSPVCMPARASLMNGLAPHQTGCVDNNNFPESSRSFMQMLSDSGYQTHGIGKMHLGGDWKRNWGFESRDTSEEVKAGHDFRAHLDANGYSNIIEPNGLRSEYYYLPQPSQLPAELHETTWVADRSIDFLNNRERERPFFLFSSFIKPHPPFESPAPWHRLYRGPEMSMPYRPPHSEETWCRINRVQNRYKYQDQLGDNDRQLRTLKSAYYGAISFIDYNLGRILEALGDEIDNTLIVFASDHGELLGDYGCFGKRSMHEASARIPCIVRYPQAIPAGEIVNTPASLYDLFPTFAAVAGSEEPKPNADSASLLDLAKASPDSRIVTSQFQHGWMGHYMATDGEWKLIHSAPDQKSWLVPVNDTGEDGPNRYNDPDCSVYRERLETALRERFIRDGYNDAFDGDEWRKYDVKPFSTDPDYGLLFQDEEVLQDRINELGEGYRREVTKPDSESYRIIFDHSV